MCHAAGRMSCGGRRGKQGTGSEVIRFRRILAPEDRIKDWPLGDGKYLPVDAAEFERLVADLQPPGAGRRLRRPSRLARHATRRNWWATI